MVGNRDDGGVTAGTGAPRAIGGAESTPLQSSKPGEHVLPVRLNGRGPFAFILDTGSSHSFISETMALELGAPAVAKSLVRSSIGLAMRPIVRLDRLEVGSVSTTDVLASLVPDDTLDPAGRIAGVIGQDVLASRRYTIDLADRRVIWHAADDEVPSDATSFALQLVDGRFLVELPQRNANTCAWCRTAVRRDSCSTGGTTRRLPPLMLAPGRTRVSTLTSEAEVQPIRVSELRVGPTNFVDLPAVLIDRHGTPARDADGLLPLHLFRRVTFDGPRRWLSVE